MLIHPGKAPRRTVAYTLMEVLISFVTLTMAMAGLIYGYTQANRMAEFSAMSLAAQSYALQGLEQARSAKWNPWAYSTNTGAGTEDELAPSSSHAVMTQVDLLDIPIKGDPFSTNAGSAFTNYLFFATNYIWVTTVSVNPPVRQIRSDCIWRFARTGQGYTNTVITMRASDQ